MTKPLVFNYQHYDTLRDKCNDMAVEIAELNDKYNDLEKKYNASLLRISHLKAEITNLQIRCRIAEADNEQGLSSHKK